MARLASTPRQRGHESPRAIGAAAGQVAGSDAVLGYGSGIYPEPYTGSGDGWAQPGSLARSFDLKPAATPFAAAEAAAPLVKRAASAASASAAEAGKISACAANRLAGRSRLAEAGIYIYLGGSDAEVQALATLPSPRGSSPKAKRDRAASASSANAAKRATAAAAATASAAASAAKAIKEKTGWDPMEHAASAAAASAAAAATAATAAAAISAAAAADAAAAQRRAEHPAASARPQPSAELQPPYPPRAAEGLDDGTPRGTELPTGRVDANGRRYSRAADFLLGDSDPLPGDSLRPIGISPVLSLAPAAGSYGVRAAAPPGSYSPRAALLRSEAEAEAEAEASVSAATTRRGNGNGAEASAAAEAEAAAETETEAAVYLQARARGGRARKSSRELLAAQAAGAEAEAEAEAPELWVLQARLADGQLLSTDEMQTLRVAETGAGAGAEAGAEVGAEAGAEAGVEAEAEAEGVASLMERMAAGDLLSEPEMARLREAAEAEAEADDEAVAEALAMAEAMAEEAQEAEEEAGVAGAVRAGAPRKYLHAQRLALSICDTDSADVHEMQELREAEAQADVQADRRSRRASKEAAYPTPRGRPLASKPDAGAMGAEDAEAVLGMLRGLRIFQDMSEDALKAVMARASVRTYQRYSVVAREGGHGTGLSVVVHGAVLRWLSPARGMLVVGGPPPPRELGPGSAFCEEVLLGDALTLTLPPTLTLTQPLIQPQPHPPL